MNIMPNVVYLFSLLFLPMLVWAEENEPFTGNLHLMYGQKYLDEDEWGPIDKHDEIGIRVDFKKTSWPISIALGYLRSDGKKDNASLYFPGVYPGPLQFDVEGETTEWQLGIKKIWGAQSNFQLFVAGGLAEIYSEVEATVLSGGSVFGPPGTVHSDTENALGVWIEGGMNFLIANSITLGFDVTLSRNLSDSDPEDGGDHVNVFVGLHW